MEDLVLTWVRGDEEYIFSCTYHPARGMQVEAKCRRAGVVVLDVPTEMAEDLAEWFEGVRKKVDQHSRRIGI